ncbi:hypothetical protein EVAR_97258_1 [Eumeta japonica]|uniref:Uncharacterized protein n=1 Tax=Eumeta variegata TaxID=151549 RepID=A0A4C1XD94_EUMVA|nr:hypothetical protein EVAR_97258_1 [Eumeta japonica]
MFIDAGGRRGGRTKGGATSEYKYANENGTSQGRDAVDFSYELKKIAGNNRIAARGGSPAARDARADLSHPTYAVRPRRPAPVPHYPRLICRPIDRGDRRIDLRFDVSTAVRLSVMFFDFQYQIYYVILTDEQRQSYFYMCLKGAPFCWSALVDTSFVVIDDIPSPGSRGGQTVAPAPGGRIRGRRNHHY